VILIIIAAVAREWIRRLGYLLLLFFEANGRWLASKSGVPVISARMGLLVAPMW
jgi:hypothetical protein